MTPNVSPSLKTNFPEKVGRYELLLPLGTGGMATVYLARSSGVGGFSRDVALKLVHAHLRADEESKLQLLEEAKLAAQIRHPNVVPVTEIDEDPFGVFLVMDYVEGETLSAFCRLAREAGTQLSRRVIARILNDALQGLHAAHELRDETGKPLGLVHRDFSPQNILISADGITRLTDFGVAKAAHRAVRTKTGLVKGKIGYMSPEQARGHEVDRRCDVWAAGVVAWELIAQQRMHRSDDDVATLLSIVTQPPRRLRDIVSDLPVAVDEAVAGALNQRAEGRCPTAEALRLGLEQAWGVDGIASTREVGDLVRSVAGARLRSRRERAAEVRRLRQRVDDLARESAGGDSSPYTVETGSELPPSTGNLEPTHASYPPASPAPSAASDGGLQPPVAEERTRTSAVLRSFGASPGTRRTRWLLTAALCVGAAVVVFIGLQVGQMPNESASSERSKTSNASEPAQEVVQVKSRNDGDVTAAAAPKTVVAAPPVETPASVATAAVVPAPGAMKRPANQRPISDASSRQRRCFGRPKRLKPVSHASPMRLRHPASPAPNPRASHRQSRS